MADDYARHLADLHARFTAPAVLVVDAARTITPSPIATKTRIVHGEANEVYALTFESGRELILRIARRAAGKFDKEAWAIGRCRALGIKAPEVLSVQKLEAAGEPLELCFMQKLPGARLSDSLSLPRETLRSVVRELGDQIARMHSIGLDDLGEAARFFENDTDDFLVLEDEFVRLGTEAGLAQSKLKRAFRFFESAVAQAAPLARQLTHNDFRACHVLVHEGRLSGLIDFGEVSMDTPINDFAKWDCWEAPDLSVAWLEEGYGDQALFDDRYGELFRAYRIANALWALRWYAMTGYAAGAARAKDRLDAYFAELGFG